MRHSSQHAAPELQHSSLWAGPPPRGPSHPRLTAFLRRATRLNQGAGGAAAGARPPHSRFTAPDQSKGSSPQYSSATAALCSQRRRVGAQRWPGPPGAPLTSRGCATPPVHGGPAPLRSLTASPVRGGHARGPAAQRQLRRGSPIPAAILISRPIGAAGRAQGLLFTTARRDRLPKCQGTRRDS
ncbi:hypothetical protein NDU88_004245 [Pleurodeles waltl]|uniref:Uncharacterized protein n=1 Tax=Pleurodeles waltl TaxID=8319 RepID=A0AAV7WTJ8_PLEWA|nr:hypothetical protein NDU88_004245 [Pleurodeles waltl]